MFKSSLLFTLLAAAISSAVPTLAAAEPVWADGSHPVTVEGGLETHNLAERAGLSLTYCQHHDLRGECYTYCAGGQALSFGTCVNLGVMNDRISSHRVTDGCCKFYLRPGRSIGMFSATNRGDKPQADHNHVISSWRCGTC